ncbi:MAG: hypothetical protein QW816_06185 [Desulfurococcaceae archaeon]
MIKVTNTQRVRSSLQDQGRKLWYIESSLYNYSINISMGIVNALAIKILGYGVVELGALMFLRLIAVALSQIPAAYLTLFHRNIRKKIWFILGAINRIGWALVILSIAMPKGIDFVYIAALTFIAQFAGGIAGVAASDTIGDLIPASVSTIVFTRVNQLNNLAIAVSYITSIAVFMLPIDTIVKYATAYSISFISAVASTIALYFIPDPLVRKNQENTAPRVHNNDSIRDLFVDKKLKNYLIVTSLFNFSVNIPAPFWDYVVLSVTKGMEVFVILKNVVNLLVKSASAVWWRRYISRRSMKKVFVRGLAFTSIIPLAYTEVLSPIEIICIEMYSGFIWMPIDLGSMVYNIYLSPNNIRPAYLSTVNLAVNLASSIASYLGTFMAIITGNVAPAFLASGILRSVTAGIASKILPDIGGESKQSE